VVPGLPDRIEITKSQLLHAINLVLSNTMGIRKAAREAELSAYGIIVNSFEELEPASIEELRKVRKQKA
jgi:hypothetical protein